MNTHSRSTYIEDLISVQDKALDSAVQALMSADAKHAASAKCATMFPIGTLGYTLRGMARTVSSPTKGPSMSLQTLLHTKKKCTY